MPATAEAREAPAAPLPQRAPAAPVLTTEELRRAALARSARRNAAVARQRLAWRRAGRLLRLLLACLLPLAVWGSLAEAPAAPAAPAAFTRAPALRWAYEPGPLAAPHPPTAPPRDARPTQEPPP